MCKHPLKAFKIGFNPKTGKDKLKICSYKVDHLEEDRNGNWIPSFTSFKRPEARDYVDEFVEIPCNHCIDCKLKYSREWANRMMMELAYYEPSECWFLTLTYDDDHLPIPINDETGEIYESKIFKGTLSLEDLQKFWKRLRENIYREYGIRKRIRYYACGEYGGTTHRSHYHAILYGCPFVDVVPWVKSKSGNMLYTSKFLSDTWGKGIVTLSPVTWNTCAYTARYVLKKAGGLTKQEYIDNYAKPEFVVMSRRPGIGRDFYEDHKKHIYEFDEIILKGDKVPIRAKPPKYFDSLYEAEDPEAYANIKDQRKEAAEITRFWKMSRTDLDYLDQLQVEENELISRLKGLYRNKV